MGMNGVFKCRKQRRNAAGFHCPRRVEPVLKEPSLPGAIPRQGGELQPSSAHCARSDSARSAATYGPARHSIWLPVHFMEIHTHTLAYISHSDNW